MGTVERKKWNRKKGVLEEEKLKLGRKQRVAEEEGREGVLEKKGNKFGDVFWRKQMKILGLLKRICDSCKPLHGTFLFSFFFLFFF